MMMNRPDPSIAVRALKSAAPYIRMYKNKVFVIKAGGAVFADDTSTRALIEQVAILHQVGIKTVLVHGGRSAARSRASDARTRDSHGERAPGHRSEVDRGDGDGAERTHQYPHSRDLPCARHRGDRALGRRRGPHPRAQARARARRAGLGRDGRLRLRRRHRLGERSGGREAAPERPDAGGEPLVRRLERHACSISMPTPWPRRSAARCRRRSWCCARARRVFSSDPPIPARSSPTPTSRVSGACAMRAASRTACCRKRSAIETAIRGGVRRVHVITYKSPDSLLAEIFTNEGTGHPGGAGLDCSESRRATEFDLRMSRLWDKGAPLDERVLAYTAGEDHLSTSAWCATTSRPRSRMPTCSRAQDFCRPPITRRSGTPCVRSAPEHCRRSLAPHARGGGLPDRHREPAHRADRRRRRAAARGPLAQRSGARGAASVSARCDTRAACRRASPWPRRSKGSRARDGAIALPGYTHMQQAMPSTVALWALGFARRDSRRRGGLADSRSAALEQEPAGIGGGLRHAESRHRPRIDALESRLRRDA